MVAEVKFDGAVAWFTIDRPSVYNALNRQCLEALSAFIQQVELEDAIRVVVLTGKGRFFCAGADIPEFLELVKAGGNASGEADFLDIVFSTYKSLRGLSKPIIAAVNGPAMGGGLELVLSSDLVLAAETAEFGDAHANYGIIPGGGGSAYLPRLLPAPIAKHLLLTGEPLPAARMYELGFINEIVPADKLVAEAENLAQRIAAKSPLVNVQMKRLANAAAARPLEDSITDEFLTLRNHTRSADLREGLTAFVERRKPVFSGR